MAKVWKFVNRKLGGHGAGIIRWLLETRIFDDKYALSHCNFSDNDVNYVVIFNSALLQYYSREYFLRLKKKITPDNQIHSVYYRPHAGGSVAGDSKYVGRF